MSEQPNNELVIYQPQATDVAAPADAAGRAAEHAEKPATGEAQVRVRESADSYFIRMAELVASRSTCCRRHVGAVLCQNKRVRGTGYNGAPTGIDSCEDRGGCLTDEHGRCVGALHAESNVLDQTTPGEHKDATVYVTDRPCRVCSLRLVNSDIREVVYLRPHPRDLEEVAANFAARGKILRHYQPQTTADRPAELSSRPAERDA